MEEIFHPCMQKHIILFMYETKLLSMPFFSQSSLL